MRTKKPAGQNSLREVERLAIEAGQGFGERVLASLAEEESQAEEEVVCEDCERRMRSRGKRQRQLATEAGELSIKRGATSARSAGSGFFPLDERWSLNESAYSPELARDMVWLSGLLPYEQASAVFERIGHRLIPGVSLWRQARRYGARLEAEGQAQQEAVSVERVVLPDRRRVEVGVKGVGMDGGMVHIRGEG